MTVPFSGKSGCRRGVVAETKTLLDQNLKERSSQAHRLLLEEAYPKELAGVSGGRRRGPGAMTFDEPLAGADLRDALYVGLTGPAKQIGAMRYVYF